MGASTPTLPPTHPSTHPPAHSTRPLNLPGQPHLFLLLGQLVSSRNTLGRAEKIVDDQYCLVLFRTDRMAEPKAFHCGRGRRGS